MLWELLNTYLNITAIALRVWKARFKFNLWNKNYRYMCGGINLPSNMKDAKLCPSDSYVDPMETDTLHGILSSLPVDLWNIISDNKRSCHRSMTEMKLCLKESNCLIFWKYLCLYPQNWIFCLLKDGKHILEIAKIVSWYFCLLDAYRLCYSLSDSIFRLCKLRSSKHWNFSPWLSEEPRHLRFSHSFERKSNNFTCLASCAEQTSIS